MVQIEDIQKAMSILKKEDLSKETLNFIEKTSLSAINTKTEIITCDEFVFQSTDPRFIKKITQPPKEGMAFQIQIATLKV